MDKIFLTVAIPTYNRKEKLHRTLYSLSKQTDKNFKILIIDNGSDYNVQDVINEFEEDLIKKIHCIKNKSNIGVCVNIALGYLYCDTKWCWGISDDDILPENAIEIVNRNIKAHEDVAFLEFPVLDYSRFVNEKIFFDNIQSYINYFLNLSKNGYSSQGNMIYCGSRVFNISSQNEELYNAFEYSFTGIAHTIIALTSLKEKRTCVVIPETPIIYDSSSGINWNVNKICTGLTTMELVPLGLSEKEKLKLMELIMPDFSFILETVFSDMQNDKVDYPYELYNKIYKRLADCKHRFVYSVVSKFCKYKWSFYILRKLYIYRKGIR